MLTLAGSREASTGYGCNLTAACVPRPPAGEGLNACKPLRKVCLLPSLLQSLWQSLWQSCGAFNSRKFYFTDIAAKGLQTAAPSSLLI